MRGIDGGTRLAGVIGWPIGHSLSPVLHGHWFARAGVAGFYVPLAVRPEDFEEAFAALPKLGFAGVNVTIPHKQRAFALVDEADETAERMGAVNTVLIDAEGRRLGRNTDGYGFLANLESRAPGWRDVVGTGRGRPAVIVGTGGAARAVACSLIEARIGHVRLINRTRAHAEELAAALASWSDARVEVVDWEDREAALGGAGLAVNGTSLGMNGQPPLDLLRHPLR